MFPFTYHGFDNELDLRLAPASDDASDNGNEFITPIASATQRMYFWVDTATLVGGSATIDVLVNGAVFATVTIVNGAVNDYEVNLSLPGIVVGTRFALRLHQAGSSGDLRLSGVFLVLP